MKYIKMLGLLAVAAAALMAFAGTASATLTEAAGDPADVGDVVHSSSEGATSLTGTITITCQKSTVRGKVTSNGTETAVGTVDTLTFTECGNHTVTPVPTSIVKHEKEGKVVEETKHFGTLSINKAGQVFSTGAEVTVLLHSFLLGTVHCIYTTSNTDIGDLTGGSPATLDIGSKSIPRTTTDGACGEHSTWEGSYKVETPGTLLVD